MYQTFSAFYGLEEMLKQRLGRELMENYCTSLVLNDIVYIFIYNLITLSELDQVQKLEQVLKN